MTGAGREGQNPLRYEQFVDYDAMDPFKRRAMTAAISTSPLLERFGYKEIRASRGESAFVWDKGDKYGAMVIEGLGTKNLVADEVRAYTGRTHYDDVAQDGIAAIINDLIVVGATPEVIMPHMSAAESNWFSDEERAHDLLAGYAQACELASVTWGGGETPTLKDMLVPGVMELSGAAVGEINPKSRLTLGEKLEPGDSMIFIMSSGIHANGLTLAREIKTRLPEGYATPIPGGSTYGEELLKPTLLYVDAVEALFSAGIDIHYMVNVTGHGWRKFMRADRRLTYIVEKVPPPAPVFRFIQDQAGNTDGQMYETFNMGVGFVVIVSEKDSDATLRVIASNTNHLAECGGFVAEGPKQVIIDPKSLVYPGETLNVR